jgi:hypothetical protein
MWSPQQIVLGLTESIWPSHVGRDLAGAIVGLRQAFPTTTANAGLLIGLPAIFLADTKPSRWLFIQSTANDVTQQYPGAIEIIDKRHFSSLVLWSIITALPRPLSN